MRSTIRSQSIRRNDLLVETGQACTRLYFIAKGLVKLSFDRNGDEFVMRFFHEDEMVTVLGSFFNGDASDYRITAIEDAELFYIEKVDLDRLCGTHHGIETFLRKFTAMASINMMRRISEILEKDAKERYAIFLRHHPGMMHRITLKDLASYLGITQVSLSLIRAQR